MDGAPHEVRIEAPALRSSNTVSQQDADKALMTLQASLKKTKFISAWPSAVPGLVALRLDSGQVAYTDKSGRYFVVGLVFDSVTGQALDRQLDGTP